MPLTFPSHAAAVLPLKFARRRWFDGVALVIGSAAPDFPYSLSPYLNYNAHTWTGLVLFCVPATVLLTILTRAAAPAVVAHMPGWRVLRPFALRDYAALTGRRHRLAVTALSAWLGAASHRLWDLVTHGANASRGTTQLTFLDAEAFAGQPWWRVLHYGSSVVGAWRCSPRPCTSPAPAGCGPGPGRRRCPGRAPGCSGRPRQRCGFRVYSYSRSSSGSSHRRR
ncbi:DUF4184 family protein [Dactylosporangium darangshiense]